MIEIWDAYDRQFNRIENVKLVRGEPIPKGMMCYTERAVDKHPKIW